MKQLFTFRLRGASAGIRMMVVSTLLLSGMTRLHAQDWYLKYFLRTRQMVDLHVFNTDRILLVGGNEQNDSIAGIYMTTDRANNFNFVCDRPWYTDIMQDLEMVNSQTGYVVGWDGQVWKTGDMGYTWDTLLLPGAAASRYYNGVSFTSAQNGVVVGGNRWRDSISTIIRTTDGGANWTIVEDAPNPWLNDVDFGDANTGVAVGDSNRVLRTTDGGATWTSVTLGGLNGNRVLNSVHFIDANTVMIAGGMPEYHTGVMQTLLRSTDGGASWTVLADQAGPMLRDVDFHSATSGHAVGDHGAVLKSVDAGLTWNTEILPPGTADSTVLHCVRFLDDHFGVIGARDAKILIFADSTIATDPALSGVRGLKDLEVYPNPSKGNVNVRFMTETDAEITISVMDMLGRETGMGARNVTGTGSHFLEIDLKPYGPGMYGIMLKSDRGAVTRRIFVSE